MELIQKKGHLSSTLSIHPYFGKVDPALVAGLLKNFADNDDIVLDPFCGSGTVLHESILRNHTCIGWDSSPLAALISTCKILGLNNRDEIELKEIRDQFEIFLKKFNKTERAKIPNLGDNPIMPRVYNISKWFNNFALEELSFIKWWIKGNEKLFTPTTRILLKLAFSKIIVKSSNQQSESNYRSIEKPNVKCRVINLFIKSLSDIVIACRAFNNERIGEDYDSVRCLSQKKDKNLIDYGSKLTATIIHRDAKKSKILNGEANIAITSPPYLMSWDYGLYHKFRFYWLEYDLDSYEETEIGRHLRRRKDDIEKYQNDMKSVFTSLYHSISKNGKVCMINSPAIVKGEFVDTNKILKNCAESTGWKWIRNIATIDIAGPHQGMKQSSKIRGTKYLENTGKKEHVLIFQKD